MALTQMEFTFKGNPNYQIPLKWGHTGVVGSGDMEILITPEAAEGIVTVKVVTPVTGFDHVWEKVLENFIAEAGVGNLKIEINDNNSTPFIVSLRLRQGLQALEEKGEVK